MTVVERKLWCYYSTVMESGASFLQQDMFSGKSKYQKLRRVMQIHVHMPSWNDLRLFQKHLTVPPLVPT